MSDPPQRTGSKFSDSIKAKGLGSRCDVFTQAGVSASFTADFSVHTAGDLARVMATTGAVGSIERP